MSEESLDYLKLCPNYYTNWEDGCCMESCTINDMNECPIHYVKGLLEEKDKAIENWQTMYESVMQTCHNDKEEIERLNKQLKNLQQEQIKEMQEHQEAMELADKTITNLVEDNRASQEWYKKQLAESESRFQAHKQNDVRIIQDQTDLIENLRQQLADTETQNKRVLEKLELIVRANQELEQKLAESEKNVEFYKERYSDATTSAYGADLMAKDYQWHLEKEIAELKQQLAEKEEEIKKLEFLQFESEENKLILATSKRITQDKISFAVEQLEKVKEFVRDNASYVMGDFASVWEDDLLNELDNQIKQLKEGK